MKKTFSNVCRCRARTSQLPNLQQADDNRSVCVVRLFVYPFGHIYIRTGVGLRTLSILCRLGNAKACALRMDERADTYAIFVYMKGTQLSFYLDYYPGYRDESTMKATIKREQCQTCLNIAEREWVRPKVKVQRHESLGIYIFAKQERSARIQRVKKRPPRWTAYIIIMWRNTEREPEAEDVGVGSRSFICSKSTL